MNTDKKQLSLINTSILLSSIVIISIGLNLSKIIFVPFFLSYMVLVLLTPISSFLNSKLKVSRRAYNAFIFIILIIIGIISVKFFWDSINQLINELDGYFSRFDKVYDQTLSKLQNEFPDLKIKSMIQEEISSPVSKLIGYFTTSLKDFTQILSFTFICCIFLLLDHNSLPEITGLDDFNKRLRRYLVIKTATSFITSILVALYLIFLDYDFVFFIALATFILNYIPSFGSILATILLIPIFGIEANSSTNIATLLIFPATIQFIIGNIIEPKFMGDAFKLGPITIVLSLVYWSIVFGPYGLFLGVPISIFIKFFLKKTNLKESIYLH